MYETHAMFNLFENKDIRTHLDFNFTEESNVFKGIKKLSISGAQEKYSAVIDNGIIRIAFLHILRIQTLTRSPNGSTNL